MLAKRRHLTSLLAAATGLLVGCTGFASVGETEEGVAPVVVATVSNPQMQDIIALTPEHFTAETGIPVEFVSLPENQMRDRVTQDVATGGGQFDVLTIGTYETPIWARLGWISDLEDRITPDYEVDDLIPTVRQALSYEDSLHALPFYGESSFLAYRTDLLEQAGITMPERPTWDEVAAAARELHGMEPGLVGICLRGLPGWGQILAPMNTVVNTFGGRWFDMEWQPQLNEPKFVEAVSFYADLITDAGQPGAASAGFTECLTIYTQGRAAMWYDATSAAGSIENPDASDVVGENTYVFAPVKETDSSGWLWAWSLALSDASQNKDDAYEFISWATSQEYIRLVGEELGWARVPPGSRRSTYEIPEYREAASAFADLTLEAIENAPIESPTVDPVPYDGIQYVAIPEFQDLGTSVSQNIAAVLAGQTSVEEALESGQREAELVVEEAQLGQTNEESQAGQRLSGEVPALTSRGVRP